MKVAVCMNHYNPWCGAIHTMNAIEDAGKEDEFESLLEDMYPDGVIDETDLNDLLWFEPESIYEALGIDYDME